MEIEEIQTENNAKIDLAYYSAENKKNYFLNYRTHFFLRCSSSPLNPMKTIQPTKSNMDLGLTNSIHSNGPS